MRDNISHLLGFLAVARAGSFTLAAKQLGMTQSGLSHAMKELETRLGLRLLNRTTRSVTTTEAGERLLRSIAPHFEGIEAGFAAVTELRDRPSGTIRISTGDHPAEAILVPAIAKILPLYPDLNVEISVNLGFVDIVAERFDAGVRLGETLAQDMVAVPIGPDMRMAVVGSPSYFANRPLPQTPRDLAAHTCVNLRWPAGDLAAWEFEKDGRALNVRVEGQVIVSNNTLGRKAALNGAGLAYLVEEEVQPLIEAGALMRVLDDWCEPFPGYHLYYPSRLQKSAGLGVIIDAVRYRPGSGKQAP